MNAVFAETNGIRQDEIPARQLHALIAGRATPRFG
jgi:hypothetical protein